MTWCWKRTSQLHQTDTCKSGAARAHHGQGMQGGPGTFCVKDPKVVPLCSISDVPLCSREFQTYTEIRKWKKYLHLFNVKVTPCGLIGSSPCSNVRLAKHLGFPGLRTVTLGKHSSALAGVLALPFNLWPSTLSHFAAANNVPSVQGKSLPALHTWVPKALLPPETHLARLFCPRRS